MMKPIIEIFNPARRHHKALTLTSRFLDGATSLRDEEWLYSYYGSGEVDPALSKYTTLFSTLASMRQAPVRRRTMRPRVIAAASVAVAVVFASAMLWNFYRMPEYSLEDVYGGSYLIRNGQKITDFKQVHTAILASQRRIDSLEYALAKADVEMSFLDIERQSIEEALEAIPDSALRDQIMSEFLN